jgi:hypothetical protein
MSMGSLLVCNQAALRSVRRITSAPRPMAAAAPRVMRPSPVGVTLMMAFCFFTLANAPDVSKYYSAL